MRVPLTVIGGFLGAGKTTLLNRFLGASRGRRVAVLVNDFGAINIDAALVASAGADAIALSNGCVCCSIGDDLTAALSRVLDTTPPFDAMVIEASGVSDPWRIAQIGLADHSLSLDGVVVLVDASAVLEQARDPLLGDALRAQVRSADLVVVNKSDLVEGDTLRAVRDWVAAAARGAAVVETSQADVPLASLVGFDDAQRACLHHGCCEGHHDHDHNLHSRVFETWSCRPSQVFAASALRDALRRLPAGVLRLKGIVRTDEHGWAEVQFAGRRGTLRAAVAEPAGGAGLVAIGLDGRLPAQELEGLFS
jgi:G3E family GTPase